MSERPQPYVCVSCVTTHEQARAILDKLDINKVRAYLDAAARIWGWE